MGTLLLIRAFPRGDGKDSDLAQRISFDIMKVIMIFQDLQKIIPLLNQHGVTYAGLFGSYLTGEARDESDVDILVNFLNPPSLLTLVALENTLSKILKKKVDLVTEGFLSPYFRDDVLRQMKIFYGKR